MTPASSSLYPLDNPALESMGVRITAWSEDRVELALKITPDMLNRSGVVHGGTICSLLDAATGYSGLYSSDPATKRHAVTLSLTTNFLANGVGEMLTAVGVVERRGKSIFFSRGEAWLDGGLLVATAVATMKYLR
ncbi:PaaI family thioesterase [Noviherbaspirillum galbum]|uniref:Medium/long-chain acyl-CoA thioesterase YigI n=1 Tax=Noviherbaspirillum galbum TaxID=2709383 RepID=A0A6B3SYH2_9BURK|nr:PaaI family thioesterase [Noviherbaspirillum galbum]NEX64835.1 PaaI family thioesterase [Noviherbaspirillum galbum]